MATTVQNPTLWQLMNSDMAAMVNITMTPEQLRQLISDVVRHTAEFVDAKYAPESYDLKQAASMLNISQGTLRKLAKEGGIGCSRHEWKGPGRFKFTFTRQDLADYDRRRRNDVFAP